MKKKVKIPELSKNQAPLHCKDCNGKYEHRNWCKNSPVSNEKLFL